MLISADLRRPVICRTFGVKNSPGLSELVMGNVSLEEATCTMTDMLLGGLSLEDIRKSPGIENISIMPTGVLPSNPVELLESKRMADIIERLKNQYDAVIFDAPPVLPVTDASLLAPRMDFVVVVYEMGRTSREALLRTKMQLESSGGKIAGIILNNTRPHTEDIASYPYYYRYHKQGYYGKEEAGNKK